MTRPARISLAAGVALVAIVTGACTSHRATSGRAPAPDAAPGGTLVVGITTPGSIDPSNAYEPAGSQVLSTVCEPIITFDPLTAKPAAGMTSSTIITNGGQLISVRLRGGIHFQNGATLTSTDMRDELSRVASAANASVDAQFLSDVKGYDFIHGDVDTNNGDALRQLTGVSTLSNNAFSVRLTRADADYLDVLGALFTAPVPRKVAGSDPTALATEPVCAGPYELVGAWRPGQNDITVSRFAGYYARNASFPRGGIGYADRIDFRIFPSVSAELAAFDAGQIDIASVPDQSLTGRGGRDKVVSAANGYVEYVGLPNGTGGSLFTQPAVHVALSQALDRGALNQAAYGGGATPAGGFFPPTVGAMYRDDACGASTPPHGDAPAAQATLTAAGVDLRGKTLKLYYNDQFQNPQLARAIAAQWHDVLGLNVVPTAEPWAQYLSQADAPAGFDGAFLESWQAPYPSADGYLYPLFHSSSVGQDNFAHFIDPTFDHAIDNVAREATTSASRTLAYQHLAGGLCQRLPLVPLLFRQWHYAVAPRVGSAIGSFTDASSGLLDLRELFLRR